MIECPLNDGGLDCSPFCPSCEGEQYINERKSNGG